MWRQSSEILSPVTACRRACALRCLKFCSSLISRSQSSKSTSDIRNLPLHNSIEPSSLMSPQLMNTMTSLSGSRVAALVLRCGVVLIFAVSGAAGQSRIISPQPQPITPQPLPTPTGPAKPEHVATLRSTDSPQGSRVALTSDQSLRDYEAYRSGDRFYVRIPAADIQRAEAVHGKAFADVRSQRTGDTTLVSFRLQPGATAHIEPRSNRLDIVITLPGATATRTPTTVASSTANSGNNKPNRENPKVARESGASRSTAASTPRDQS